MNKLILIGNGFDLAHGLKTDYNSFLIGYLKKCLAASFHSPKHIFEDHLMQVTTVYPNHHLNFSNHPELIVSGISQMVDFFYKNDLNDLLHKEYLIFVPGGQIANPFKIKIKSQFFKGLIEYCRTSNWVDIENEFYRELKQCIKQDSVDVKSVKTLNESLKAIIIELEEYLSQLDTSVEVNQYPYIIHPYFCKGIYDQTMVLNFNYTNTVEKYVRLADLPAGDDSITVNYIHGKIGEQGNPLIFGFGDELDRRYQDIELSNNNAFFEHIKSFWYFKTRNYTNLLNFISLQRYEVFILGHSCGLSDRTLLNMIFEHSNCYAIKIFYHQREHGNNFTNLTYEIARHFRNKVQMRERMTPFPDCMPMPQLERKTD